MRLVKALLGIVQEGFCSAVIASDGRVGHWSWEMLGEIKLSGSDKGGCSPGAVHGPLAVGASLGAEHELWSTGASDPPFLPSGAPGLRRLPCSGRVPQFWPQTALVKAS